MAGGKQPATGYPAEWDSVVMVGQELSPNAFPRDERVFVKV
ncbi:hypothetical protein SNOG_09803 [Parastagonospora nodorum SN15]|uniref:Uncharacterized protein n=1 Tax=Phaeosphaeria nodorum (strain SN15 / ATCC MYA-4574 / FGSC 10173) TaxID=321614 RepID=Q0UEL1_PHANO|nr:hypothetical protein SNOG_09803 [Parastagonospora nodorum SN15]EAT83068.1 hypothetical protein SNOG_09803 [Parastagonospora nodorum SN15]